MSIKEFINEYRIFPRLFLLSFGWVSYEVIQWFMLLEAPNNSQGAFVSAMVAVLSFILRNYSESGIKIEKK